MTEPTEVDALEPGATGRWLIHSRHSVHVLDLDAGTYHRRPGPASQSFAYDNSTVTLTRIEVWPRVGGRMVVWFDDPAVADRVEQYRVCSRIRRITRVDQHGTTRWLRADPHHEDEDGNAWTLVPAAEFDPAWIHPGAYVLAGLTEDTAVPVLVLRTELPQVSPWETTVLVTIRWPRR